MQDQINDLQARLRMAQEPNSTSIEAVLEPANSNRGVPTDLQKEAEEVGFLTTGGSEWYYGSKYGKMLSVV